MSATVTPIGSRRHATLARWQAALRRALAGNVRVYQEASTGMTIVSSATTPGVCYVTDGAACTCQAGENGDPVCVHRAAYWYLAGVLDPEPEPPAAGPLAC